MRVVWLMGLVLSVVVSPLAVAAETVALQWDYAGTGYTGFQVARCTAVPPVVACEPATPLPAGALPITARSFEDRTALAGETQCWKVVATRQEAAESPPSNTVCKLVAAVVSGAPTNLREIAPPAAAPTATPKR